METQSTAVGQHTCWLSACTPAADGTGATFEADGTDTGVTLQWG